MIDRGDAPTVGAKGITFESRIAVTALATAVVVLILTSGLFIYEQWSNERASIGRGLVVMTQTMGEVVGRALDQGDPASARASLAAMAKAAPSVRQAEILSPTGAVLTSVTSPPLPEAWGGFANQSRVTTRATLIQRGRSIGTLVIVFQPPAFVRMLPRYLAVCGALFFAAVAIALLLGRVLARRVIHPVNRLSQAMRDVTERGDYSQRVPDWAQDEFGALTESFNTLLAQLQANDQALHRAMSDLLEARDAAQASNVLKSQFLANMSHEIRTPLNGVLTMAQIMALGELAPEQRARVEVIRRSGEDLLTVLSDILDLSKIEAGMMTLEDDALDLSELKAKLVAIHQPIAAEKPAVTFTFTLSPQAGGPRRGDQARIQRILTNLISNALKFTARGEVCVRLDGYGPDGRDGLKFEVTDTGVGMAKDTLPLLFQKFSQVDGSNTRRFGGAGLGLAICRELVRMMGGRIEVESIEGEGSTFTVTLPLAAIDPAAPSEPDRDVDRRLRVLAAEDIPTNQMVLSTIMESFDAQLHMVDDGLQALKAWREGDFDLILMDIQMPVMDGAAATRAIRAEEGLSGRARTPIIAVSANAMSYHARAYLVAGMDAHVPKPISLDNLHAAMRAVIGERIEGALLSEND